MWWCFRTLVEILSGAQIRSGHMFEDPKWLISNTRLSSDQVLGFQTTQDGILVGIQKYCCWLKDGILSGSRTKSYPGSRRNPTRDADVFLSGHRMEFCPDPRWNPVQISIGILSGSQTLQDPAARWNSEPGLFLYEVKIEFCPNPRRGIFVFFFFRFF